MWVAASLMAISSRPVKKQSRETYKRQQAINVCLLTTPQKGKASTPALLTYSAANSFRQINEYFVSCTFEGSYPSFYSVKLDGKSAGDKADEVIKISNEFLGNSRKLLCQTYTESGNSEGIAEYCD